MDVQLVLSILEQGLKLWNAREANKYIDMLNKLKKDWYEEYNKPLEYRSDLALDDIELRLRILCQSFVQAPKRTNTEN